MLRADHRRVLARVIVEVDADVGRRNDGVMRQIVRQAVRHRRQRLVLVLVGLDFVQVVGQSETPEPDVVAAVARGRAAIENGRNRSRSRIKGQFQRKVKF